MVVAFQELDVVLTYHMDIIKYSVPIVNIKYISIYK